MSETSKVKVDGEGGASYVVEGTNLSGVFEAVSAETRTSGEALVQKVLELAPGRIKLVTRLQDGKREDDVDGTAAVRIFNAAGATTLKAHYKDNVHTDVNGEAAFQQFDDETGRLVSLHHYSNGVLNDTADEPAVMQAYSERFVSWQRYTNGRRSDGANGEPSIQQFNTEGVLLSQQRYKDGQINDGANGEPGYEVFNDRGQLVESFHCKDGQLEARASGRIKNFIANKLHH